MRIIGIIAVSLTVGGIAAARGPETESTVNWPQWRGPEGNGISRATNLPTTWGPDKNIVWKTPMPSWSGGTPVIWEDRIFVTSASKAASKADPAAPAGQQRQNYGRQRDPGGPSLLLICVSKKD